MPATAVTGYNPGRIIPAYFSNPIAVHVIIANLGVTDLRGEDVMFISQFRKAIRAGILLLGFGWTAAIVLAAEQPGASRGAALNSPKSAKTSPNHASRTRQNAVIRRQETQSSRVAVRDSRNRKESRPTRRYSPNHHPRRFGVTNCPPFTMVCDYPSLSGEYHFEAYEAALRLQRRENARIFNEQDMAARKSRLLAQHEQAVRAGLRRLKTGQYPQALAAFSMAARLNQGDPACRIHLAQTQLALGRYVDAGATLRRALQLQPQLVYLDLHLETYYSNERELELYGDELASWLRVNAAEPEVYFLHGYIQFQLGNYERAHRAFSRVREVLPEDELTNEFIGLTAGMDRPDVGHGSNQVAPNDR